MKKIQNFKLKSSYQKSEGFIALFTVLIVASASLIMAYSAFVLGVGELDLGYTSQKGEEAFSVADGCMEESLRRIKLNTSYGVGSGAINLTTSNGSCIINVVDLGSNQRRITIEGASAEYNKKIESVITLNGSVISLDSWSEKNN